MQTPRRNKNATLRTVTQMMADTNFCRDTVVRLAEESESIIRVGRAIRIDAAKFFEYVSREYAG